MLNIKKRYTWKLIINLIFSPHRVITLIIVPDNILTDLTIKAALLKGTASDYIFAEREGFEPSEKL